MTTTTEMRELGAAFAKINDTYHRKMLGYLGSFAPMEDFDLFWKMVEKLQNCIARLGKEDTKRGCTEFVRGLCFDSSHAWPQSCGMTEDDRVAMELKNWETVVSFLTTYEKLKNRLYIANYKQLQTAIPEDWKKFCLDSENYIHMHIEEALEEYYFRIVRVREERDE